MARSLHSTGITRPAGKYIEISKIVPMSKLKINIDNKSFILKPSQLIQSGGEGMVFKLKDTAVKIYHQPLPIHQAKIEDWLQSGLPLRLPPNIFGPEKITRNERNQFVGFQMQLLPDICYPLKQLSNPIFWKKQNLNVAYILSVFQEIYATLSQLHQQTVIVGDLNDHNLYFRLTEPKGQQSNKSYWVDVDSYQFSHYPCSVAMESFLDPKLYSIGDLSQKMYFTPLTDWYAFLTLFVKSLLHVHPFGGVHHRYKTLKSRAESGISILNPTVTFPKQARPLEILSDELLHHIYLTYEKGERTPFPILLLNQFFTHLAKCSQCGLTYSSQRPNCPSCRCKTPVSPKPRYMGDLTNRLLIQVDGFIEYVAIQPNGRIILIVRTGNCYKLIRLGIGGKLDEMMLFDGQPDYRFGYFHQHGEKSYLVVNPAHGDQLLVLEVSGQKLSKLTMLETAKFRNNAVFSTSRDNLYRISGNWIMRGSVKNGFFVEEAIATVHKDQTIFWASPLNDFIAGYHRVLADYQFFLINSENSCFPLRIPFLTPGESLMDAHIAFGYKSLAIILKIGISGRFRQVTHISDLQGQIQYSFTAPLNGGSVSDLQPGHYPFTTKPDRPFPPFVRVPSSLHLSDEDILHTHPAGMVVQKPDRLYIFTK